MTEAHPVPSNDLDLDLALMKRIEARDEAAFETLFATYETAIRRHITRTVRDPEAAEDLVQEVFLRAWTHAAQWTGQGSLKAWLYSIATNLSLNHLRAANRRPQQPLELPEIQTETDLFKPAPPWLIDPSTLDPDAALEQADDRSRLQQLIAALPPEKREVFRQVHLAHRPLRDVAAQLGVPEGTVKSRLYYGLKTLARLWQEDEFE